MNILLIGCGRMGLRHLIGLNEIKDEIFIIDPRKNAEKDAHDVAVANKLKAKINFFTSFKELPHNINIDAAIMSATAQNRLERLYEVINLNIRNILIEKPIEQSRKRFQEIIDIASKYKLKIRCNHYHRTLPFFAKIKKNKSPLNIILTGGAFGLACNGIHWIDLAVYLSGSQKGKLLFGEIESTIIESGRGTNFRDYGGRGLFAFEDGSRLFINSSADSSAPMTISIIQAHNQFIIDIKEDLAIIYRRPNSSNKPNYLYGADYIRSEIRGIYTFPLWNNTIDWIRYLEGRGKCLLPKLEEALIGNELLFDLLETTSSTKFSIT